MWRAANEVIELGKLTARGAANALQAFIDLVNQMDQVLKALTFMNKPSMR